MTHGKRLSAGASIAAARLRNEADAWALRQQIGPAR